MKNPTLTIGVVLIAAGVLLHIGTFLTLVVMGDPTEIGSTISASVAMWMIGFGVIFAFMGLFVNLGQEMYVAVQENPDPVLAKAEANVSRQIGRELVRLTLAWYIILLFSAQLLINLGGIGQTLKPTKISVFMGILLNLPVFAMAILTLVTKTPGNAPTKTKTIMLKGLALFTTVIISRNIVNLITSVGKTKIYTSQDMLISMGLILPILAFAALTLVMLRYNPSRKDSNSDVNGKNDAA